MCWTIETLRINLLLPQALLRPLKVLIMVSCRRGGHHQARPNSPTSHETRMCASSSLSDMSIFNDLLSAPLVYSLPSPALRGPRPASNDFDVQRTLLTTMWLAKDDPARYITHEAIGQPHFQISISQSGRNNKPGRRIYPVADRYVGTGSNRDLRYGYAASDNLSA